MLPTEDLFVHVYVLVDDAIAAGEVTIPARPGPTPACSDAELLTIALVQFFFLWNDLLVALTFTTSDDLRTVQVGLLNFTGQFGTVEYGPTFAAICINVLLILAIYVFLNQRVMRGLSAGAVKG